MSLDLERDIAGRKKDSRVCGLCLAFYIVLSGTSLAGSSLILHGEYVSEVVGPSQASKVLNRASFTAEVAEGALHFSYGQDVQLPRKYGVSFGDALIQHWLSPTSWVVAYRPAQLSLLSVIVDLPQFPNTLGSCRDAAASTIFVTVKGFEFFDPSTNAKPFAPPWFAAEDPRSLIHMAKYSYSGNPSQTVTGQIIVAKELYASWERSPLLNVAYGIPRLKEEAKRKIDRSPIDSVVGDFRLHSATNIGEWRIPTLAEFRAYLPRKDTVRLQKGTATAVNVEGPQADFRIDRVVISSVALRTDPVETIPLIEGNIQVEDRRLYDRETRIVQAAYFTNRFDSFTVAPQAKADLEQQKEKRENTGGSPEFRDCHKMMIGMETSDCFYGESTTGSKRWP